MEELWLPTARGKKCLAVKFQRQARCYVVRYINQLASAYWPPKMFVTTVFIMALAAPGIAFLSLHNPAWFVRNGESNLISDSLALT